MLLMNSMCNTEYDYVDLGYFINMYIVVIHYKFIETILIRLI